MQHIVILFLILLTSQAFAAKRVMLISWDGFRPAFVTSDKFKTPNTRKLLKDSAYSLELEPINPTVTYPNHTTMVTGVPSSVHGILSNSVFDAKKGPLPAWYWESDKIKTTPIWKQAFEEGKKTSIFGWPVTVGGKATWLFPETFTVKGMNKTNEELIRAESGAEALKEIEGALGARIPTDNELEHDQWVTKAAVYLEKKHQPDLQLVHLINVDHWQHLTGINSKETLAAVEEIDRQVGELSKSLTDKDTCLIILGDHGHADYKKVFNINTILKNRGMIQLNKQNEVQSWKAIAHVSGSQAAIYLQPKTDRKTVLKMLKKELKNDVTILSKSEFKDLNVYPEADFMVVSKIGFSLSGGFKDKEIDNLKSPESTHGYLGSTDEMKTVFMARGCGIELKNIGKMSMLEVAPTVAKLLGLKLKAAKSNSVL